MATRGALPTMQAEAVGRLGAILGRSPLDAPEQVSEAAPEEPALWLDEDPGARPNPTRAAA